ncbi:MAG: TonB-dependent receptor [Burkholderiaceae bacterium]|nr:TonB-dependent receptor [Burkholderiaceae bacterium]
MSFRVKPMVHGLALAFGGFAAISTTAYAQQSSPPSQTQQQLERITITGSNIRRTDQETVAPVEIITREQIERSGRPTVADVLRSIPANTGGSFSESFSNSFAPGAAGISLRGLGQKSTLVLLNGRRITGYGFAQNLQETFVDLNSIPTSAVERIEVLKDGASAIYGSDAIAGVVNIILRRDFRGIEAAGDVGFFEGERDYRASIVAGFGDLGSQRFNVFGVLDYYKREELLLSDTKHGRDRDYRDEDGGRNFQSLTAGGTWQNVTGTTAAGTPIVGNMRRAISQCAQIGGTVLDFAGAVQRGLINLGFNAATGQPNPPPALGGAAATNLNQPGNSWCSIDVNNQLSAIPGTERIGFLGRGVFDFTPSVQAFAEVAYTRTETEQTFTKPVFITTALQPTPAGLQPFSYNIIYGPGVAGNPFGTNATFTGNLQGVGTRNTEIESDTYRGLLGLRYGFAGWDLESAVGYSKNEVESFFTNRASKSGISAAFNIPSTPQPPTPISTSATYNLDLPLTNSAAVNSSILVNLARKAESELKFVDTKATTQLGSLPGGAIGLAVGAEYREESLQDRPDNLAITGQILGQGNTATDGKRDNYAGYVELALPFTRAIEAQAALRYDDYSDFGSTLNPKLGLKFRPAPEVLLRANWGRGFRAPSLVEITPSRGVFFVQVNDTVNNLTNVQVSGVFTGNPNLQPEKSRSTTAGIVWEPSNSFNASVDVYDISFSNIVSAPGFQGIVNANNPSQVIRLPPTPQFPGGQIVTVLNGFINVNRTETRGVDVDARYIARTSWGRFTTRLNTTYVAKFEEDGTENAGRNGGSVTVPRWKGFASLDWDQGPWTVTGRMNYIHSYYQDFLAGSFFTPQDPRFQNGTYPTRVPSYTTFDAFARYNVTANLSVSASVLNIFDRTPPYDPGADGTNIYDFTQYDVRGTIYRVGLKYKFR